MTLDEFVTRWQNSTLSERAAAQSHFLDLCAVLGKATPAGEDSSGAFYSFEKAVEKVGGGGKGYVDVWKHGAFAWEYKGKARDLQAALRQVTQYLPALENPPLLVVCDLNRFEIHTNWTNAPVRVYRFTLADLRRSEPTPDCAIPPLDALFALWDEPERLRPDRVSEQITEKAAQPFAEIAASLRARGNESHVVAHFLIRVIFCLFAEDIGLLPRGLFTNLIESSRGNSARFAHRLRNLFAAMRAGGDYGSDEIRAFNGGLFDDDAVLEMSDSERETLLRAARTDWQYVSPSVLGTLFERSLDPDKRSQLGAHYTSEADIRLIVEPVALLPLRREWDAVRVRADALVAERDALDAARQVGVPQTATQRAQRERKNEQIRAVLQTFAERLADVRVLDPACGSGNFLFVALKGLLDLNRDIIAYATGHGLTQFFPVVEPEQMRGLELNEYAAELAPVAIWIGYIQWLHQNGFGLPAEPILKNTDLVTRQDAILAVADDGTVTEPVWPDADFIVGNPPFLGGNRVRQELGNEYVERLFALYNGRVPAFADLVCYWHEKARAMVEGRRARRVGLLATNSIRGGANRKVLERAKASGDLFFAWADRPWVLDGAAVRVSMVGFDDGSETERTLDGLPVASINADLTGAIDLTKARRLAENFGLCFMGPSPKAPFDIDEKTAAAMLTAPININGKPNSDVVRPVVSAIDLARGSRRKWTIDFGMLTFDDASLYEMPFEHVKKTVWPIRQTSRKDDFQGQWWRYARPRPEMRVALKTMERFVVTPAVSKHRLFVWASKEILANQGTLVMAREDDYFFGVLHSRAHELWALRMGTFMGVGNDPRYTPTTTFETFPFPFPPGTESPDDPHVVAIAAAAKLLNERREAWLNPPGATPADLKTRTLTNLYNTRPSWLQAAHATLDRTMFAAYGWPTDDDLTDDAILERLLALNLERSARTTE